MKSIYKVQQSVCKQSHLRKKEGFLLVELLVGLALFCLLVFIISQMQRVIALQMREYNQLNQAYYHAINYIELWRINQEPPFFSNNLINLHTQKIINTIEMLTVIIKQQKDKPYILQAYRAKE